MSKNLYRLGVYGDYKLRSVDISFTDDIAAGGSKDITIPHIDGYILRPHSVYFVIAKPPAATSGDHKLFIYNSDMPTNHAVSITTTYTADMNLIKFDPGIAGSFYPADREAWNTCLRLLDVSHPENLIIQYRNDSNVTQTNNATGKLFYRLISQID